MGDLEKYVLQLSPSNLEKTIFFLGFCQFFGILLDFGNGQQNTFIKISKESGKPKIQKNYKNLQFSELSGNVKNLRIT